jgi:hypothetical protein
VLAVGTGGLLFAFVDSFRQTNVFFFNGLAAVAIGGYLSALYFWLRYRGWRRFGFWFLLVARNVSGVRFDARRRSF